MPRKNARLSPEALARDRAYTAEWKKKNTVIIPLQVRKGERERYKQLAARRGVSLTRLILSLLDAEDSKDAKG